MPLNTVETEKLKLYLGVESTMGTFGSTMFSRGVNSYTDYKETVNVVARNPIGNDRMANEGTVTSKEHMAGWNQDLTQNNTQDIFPQALFADMVEVPKTNPLYGTETPITSMTATVFGGASGLTKFIAGNIILPTGCPTESNNVPWVVASATSTAVTVTGTMTDDDIISGQVTLERVGHAFTSGDVSIAYTSGTTGTLTCTTSGTLFQDLGIVRGQLLILDAQGSTNAFVDNRGFIRVRSVATVASSSVITFDYSSFTPTTEAGTGKVIRVWWGDFVKNNVGSGVKDKSLSTLRVTPVSAGDEWDVKVGCGIDEVTINIPKPASDAKVDIDVKTMAMRTQRYSASDSKPSATRTAINELACYATANELISSRFYKRTGATTPFPSRSVVYISDGNISIKNNVSIPTAWGSTDGFDVNKGKLDVTGSLTGYYSSDAIETSISSKDMFGLSLFFGRPVSTNYAEGIFFDIPYVQAQSDGKDAQDNGVIMLPLNITAVKDPYLLNVFGVSYFSAMPRHILTALGANVV